MTQQEMRELDNWIAINVMGYCRVETKRGGHFTCHYRLNEFEHGVECGGFRSMEKAMEFLDCHIPSYSKKPEPAMDVLKKCADELSGMDIKIRNRTLSGWLIQFDDITTQSETLELTICLFAKALFSKEGIADEVDTFTEEDVKSVEEIIKKKEGK